MIRHQKDECNVDYNQLVIVSDNWTKSLVIYQHPRNEGSTAKRYFTKGKVLKRDPYVYVPEGHLLFMEGSDAEASRTNQNPVEASDATASRSDHHGEQREANQGEPCEVNDKLCFYMDEISMVVGNTVFNALLDTDPLRLNFISLGRIHELKQ
jgi:hypothetical protein